jgi:hypothetical protein
VRHPAPPFAGPALGCLVTLALAAAGAIAWFVIPGAD